MKNINMPGFKRKGRTNKKRIVTKFEVIEPQEGEIIAMVQGSQGGYPPRFSCESISGEQFVAPIQGSIAKGPRRVLVRNGDYVLCQPLECNTTTHKSNSIENKKYFIHHVYTKDDVKYLEKKGYLTKKKMEQDNYTFVNIGETKLELENEDEVNVDDI